MSQLAEALRKLDMAIEDAKKAIYNNGSCKMTRDEALVYNAMVLKIEDFNDFMKFMIKGGELEHGKKTRASAFSSAKQ